RLKGIWRSPVYGLYQDKVEIGYEGPCKYHLFTCANPKCRLGKNHKRGTVRRYLDSKDRSATGNLLTHARACQGREAVDSVLGGASQKPKGKRDGSIYSAFARMGSKVARFCHKPQTAQETSNRPAKIVADPRFNELMKTGRPSTTLPSPRQVARDVHSCFDLARARIANLLQEYPGSLNFSTDSWSSPNHRAIVAWTVHLQHEGKALSFLIDVIEVPESHTGETLARAF
ncbi:hypothetical protein C8J57DRAFT_994173, partial [Mycena rebaudengoi]